MLFWANQKKKIQSFFQIKFQKQDLLAKVQMIKSKEGEWVGEPLVIWAAPCWPQSTNTWNSGGIRYLISCHYL